jgi:hypothetical protein
MDYIESTAKLKFSDKEGIPLIDIDVSDVNNKKQGFEINNSHGIFYQSPEYIKIKLDTKGLTLFGLPVRFEVIDD